MKHGSAVSGEVGFFANTGQVEFDIIGVDNTAAQIVGHVAVCECSRRGRNCRSCQCVEQEIVRVDVDLHIVVDFRLVSQTVCRDIAKRDHSRQSHIVGAGRRQREHANVLHSKEIAVSLHVVARHAGAELVRQADGKRCFHRFALSGVDIRFVLRTSGHSCGSQSDSHAEILVDHFFHKNLN